MSAESKTMDPDEKIEKTRQKAQEKTWVERAQSGDQDAFRCLVERYQRRVYAVAYGIVRNHDDAWDIAQESFVKAYRNLGRFQGKSGFYTWIYRITYNLCILEVLLKLAIENRKYQLFQEI